MKTRFSTSTARPARHRNAALALTAAACILLTACGGSGASVDKSSGSGSQANAAFQKKVDAVVAERSAKITTTPPTTGPKAAAGKKVYVIACVMAAEGCARESRAAIEAGKAIGWETKLIDTQSLPDKMVAAVNQAIDDKADGIVFEAIDMKTLAAPIAKARKAGLKIVCFACRNQDGLADQTIPGEDSFVADGYALGAAMYKATNGHPKLIMMKDEASFGIVGFRVKGTEKFFADCKAAGGDCEIVQKIDFLVTELTTRVPQLATGAARKNPEANAIWMPYDSASSFITQGLRQAGVANGKIGLYGFDGNSANIKDIRDGNFQIASMAGPFEWAGWAEIDALNRLFQGEKPVNDIVKIRLITKDSLPANDNWSGDIDFKPGYLKAWGV